MRMPHAHCVVHPQKHDKLNLRFHKTCMEQAIVIGQSEFTFSVTVNPHDVDVKMIEKPRYLSVLRSEFLSTNDFPFSLTIITR